MWIGRNFSCFPYSPHSFSPFGYVTPVVSHFLDYCSRSVQALSRRRVVSLAGRPRLLLTAHMAVKIHLAEGRSCGTAQPERAERQPRRQYSRES